MKKPITRQLKKIEGGNELVVCVTPENRKKLDAGEGDNLLQRYNPDSGVVEISKVVQSSNRQQNETRENKSAENESTQTESRVDLADRESQGQQDDVSKFKHCTSCGSEDIQVTGNQLYCGDCDVTYEVTPRGTKVVNANPSQVVDDLENRVEQLEEAVDDLNNNSDKDKNSGGFLSRFFGFADDENDVMNQGFIRFEVESENAHVAVGTGSDDDDDDDDDDDEFEDNGDPKPFITW